MFRKSFVALLGSCAVADQDDAASLLQKRSRNSMSAKTLDDVKQTAFAQLESAVSGKECKSYIEDQQSAITEEQWSSVWNNAWFDGEEPPDELANALACAYHVLPSLDENHVFPAKTCKNNHDAQKECGAVAKRANSWLRKRLSKLIKERRSKSKVKYFNQKLSPEFASAEDVIADLESHTEPHNDMFGAATTNVAFTTWLFPSFQHAGSAVTYLGAAKCSEEEWIQGELNQAGQASCPLLNDAGATAVQISGTDFFYGSLPPAIRAFYGAVQGIQGDEALPALQWFHADAHWAHTGLATAIGIEEIGALFKQEDVRSVITQTTVVQHVATDTGDASSFVVTRCADMTDRATRKDEKNSCAFHKRDAFVLVENKIKMVWTTNGDKNDPTMDSNPWFDTNEIAVSGGDEDLDAVETVQTAIEVYFNGFVGHDASAMQSAYHQDNPLFMADFKPERKAPVACAASENCGTLPYMNNFDNLLPAFEAFVQQPSHIQLNRQFTPAGVYGNFAYVSTVSFGCEGNMVTPEGDTPAPNRELFVATRTESDGWKIRFYMFSIDPKSPIDAPVDICDLNRDTPGSVWPDPTAAPVTTTVAPAPAQD